MTIQLDQRLAEHARLRPGAMALTWHDPATTAEASPAGITYGELHAAIDRTAARLHSWYPNAPGATLLLRSPNEASYVITFLAILRAGLKVFPVNPQIGDTEMQAAARRTGAIALITSSPSTTELPGLDRITMADLTGHEDSAPSPCIAMPQKSSANSEAGLLLQSSGTTGLPKIVLRDRPSLDAVARNVAAAAGLQPSDRVLAVVHLSHSFGIENGMLGPLWAGSTVHLLKSTDASSLPQVLASGNITVLPAVPFLFELLSQSAPGSFRSHSLRLAYSAGATLPPAVFDACARDRGMRIGQLYGATEVGSVTFNHPDEEPFDPAAVGRPMDQTSILILDPQAPDPRRPLPAGHEGHVAVHAPSMFRFYVDGPTDELRDRYFLTGDLGRIDDRGRLTITGRLKLLIDVGGIKVNPVEVELVLAQHPLVRDCVVVPLPITQTIDRLKAIITLRNPAGHLDPDDLRRFASQRLSPYKVPRVVEIVASLPRSPTGKILRQNLTNKL